MANPSIADSLENASMALDQLIHDARLPPRRRHDENLADIEERAMAIVASIIAAVRPQMLSAMPIVFETDGKKSSAWFG